ncbi:MAG TPA: tRNA (adenosine(37)-N6)-threonylcarbamoyltransferase complex ATPase subunit type 1 TsaE [Candidatus Paceibacterota bacterium]|nr:tRNA (adenosine(37)-N6)-threonylcarbamoyltransferase complex ATPase subunit type 1 TsaE [Candidatus Paceibacterota bacterium]
MKRESLSLEETRRIAEEFLSDLKPVKDQATLVCLSGDLGAGKTAFTQSIASVLGIADPITSPTFVLEKIYRIPDHPRFSHLIHIDAYRLESGRELAALGWDSILSEPKNLIILEWPERVANLLPVERLMVNLTFINETTRIIEW